MSNTKNSTLSEEILPLTIASEQYTPDFGKTVSDEEGHSPRCLTRSLARVLNEISLHIISTSRQGIIVYDPNLAYVLWNPMMEEMTGLNSRDVVGRHYSELFPFLQELG